MTHTYNPDIDKIVKTIDRDNGEGYHVNIPQKGQIFRIGGESQTRMLYDVKIIEKVKVIFIRYIHYDNNDELIKLMAFATKFWRNLEASMVYYREKDRDNNVGPFLERMGFSSRAVINDLEQFNCNRDSWPCKCKVKEYYITGVDNRR